MEIQMHEQPKKNTTERHGVYLPSQASRPNLVEPRDRPSYVDAETQYEAQVAPERVKLEDSSDRREEEEPPLESESQYVSDYLPHTLV